VSKFFYRLGQSLGGKMRRANWLYRSLAGTEAEAFTAEHAVGRDLARAFLAQLPRDPDPAAQQALDAVGGRLASCLRDKHWRFVFVPVQAPQVNAFALPGGFVFVTRPLLQACAGSPAELAFVLGHEMGHVVRRHAVDRLMADTLVGGLKARLPTAGTAVRAQVAALLGKLLHQGYSREQELQADVTGLQLLRAAGYDASASLAVLRRLAAGSAAEPLAFSYFSTHPPLPVRLAQAERWLHGGRTSAT